MENEDLVTVVVTLYNKENYIEHCLESISNQSYQNLEVIVVNDGSTDNSLFKAKKVESKDPRFKVVNKKNGGLSSARNYGIRLARGQEIIFIDGDDYVDKNYVLNLMKYCNYDLVISGFYKLINGRKVEACNPKDATVKTDKFKDYIFNSDHYYYCVLAWNKLFKANIIKNNNLNYENIVMGEDADFFFKYLAYCQKIKVISQADYCNVVIPDTLSRKKVENLWQHNLEVVSSAMKYLSLTKKEYAFLIMRSVKVTLGGNCDDYTSFKAIFKEITESTNFKKIKFSDITEKQNALIFIGMKLKLIKLLQKLFQIRVKKHS